VRPAAFADFIPRRRPGGRPAGSKLPHCLPDQSATASLPATALPAAGLSPGIIGAGGETRTPASSPRKRIVSENSSKAAETGGHDARNCLARSLATTKRRASLGGPDRASGRAVVATLGCCCVRYRVRRFCIVTSRSDREVGGGFNLTTGVGRRSEPLSVPTTP
jgi:hypothetical protein